MTKIPKIDKYGLADIFLDVYNGTGNNSSKTARILSEQIQVKEAGDKITRCNVDTYVDILKRINEQKTTPLAERENNKKLIVEQRKELMRTWEILYGHFVRNIKFILEDLDPDDETGKKKLEKADRMSPSEKIGLITACLNKTMKRSFDFHNVAVPQSSKQDVSILIVKYEEQVDSLGNLVKEVCCDKCRRKLSSGVRSLQTIQINH